MENNAFEEPVTIIRGLGFPAAVETVAGAYAFLAEWPYHQRRPAHKMALEACRAALDGKMDAQTARSKFVAFARNSGILMPESNTLVVMRVAEASTEQPQS